tara:strand:- start:3938 stop:4303 length:366 start_codon:yes stop_codon:yes gene_type:complete
MEWKAAWRIFELDPTSGHPMTLMHPHKGTRILPLETEMRAYQGIVSNPGKKDKTYRAGWHVGLSEQGVRAYLRLFKKNRPLRVCRVLVASTRPKPRSPHGIHLARYMKIRQRDWDEANLPL